MIGAIGAIGVIDFLRSGIDLAKRADGAGPNRDAWFQDGVSDSAAADYSPLGTQAGRCHHCHTGECPVGISTQDGLPEQRLRR